MEGGYCTSHKTVGREDSPFKLPWALHRHLSSARSFRSSWPTEGIKLPQTLLYMPLFLVETQEGLNSWGLNWAKGSTSESLGMQLNLGTHYGHDTEPDNWHIQFSKTILFLDLTNISTVQKNHMTKMYNLMMSCVCPQVCVTHWQWTSTCLYLQSTLGQHFLKSNINNLKQNY